MDKLAVRISYVGTHVLWVTFLLLILGLAIYSNFTITTTDLLIGGVFATWTLVGGELLKRKLNLGKKNRTDRTLFLLIMILGWSVISIFSWQYISTFFQQALIYAIPTTLLILLNNYFYRISFHVALTTSLLILINYFSGWNLVWLFLVIPLIAWSRVRLGKHTILQVIMGFLMPVVTYALVFYLVLGN